MRKQTLSESQAQVLEKIAHRSKMDEWFRIDENGIVAERDIITLVEGATDYDFEVLSPKEMCILADILIKCKPNK